jgi:hypothetical protein
MVVSSTEPHAALLLFTDFLRNIPGYDLARGRSIA